MSYLRRSCSARLRFPSSSTSSGACWNGRRSDRNPWDATTLEWDTPSPPPHGNFDKELHVYRGPYEYSVPGADKDFTPQTEAARRSASASHEPALVSHSPTKSTVAHANSLRSLRPGPIPGSTTPSSASGSSSPRKSCSSADLFSAYIFLRLGAEPGYWPHGLLNVPVGTFNTAILIASSVTVVLAWASLKMRQCAKYKFYMLIDDPLRRRLSRREAGLRVAAEVRSLRRILKKEARPKYEQYLGNEHLEQKKLPPRIEISGHLLDAPNGLAG